MTAFEITAPRRAPLPIPLIGNDRSSLSALLGRPFSSPSVAVISSRDELRRVLPILLDQVARGTLSVDGPRQSMRRASCWSRSLAPFPPFHSPFANPHSIYTLRPPFPTGSQSVVRAPAYPRSTSTSHPTYTLRRSAVKPTSHAPYSGPVPLPLLHTHPELLNPLSHFLLPLHADSSSPRIPFYSSLPHSLLVPTLASLPFTNGLLLAGVGWRVLTCQLGSRRPLSHPLQKNDILTGPASTPCRRPCCCSLLSHFSLIPLLLLIPCSHVLRLSCLLSSNLRSRRVSLEEGSRRRLDRPLAETRKRGRNRN